jgi:beta-glucosidase
VPWEAAGKAPVSGDGSGFATRYAEDFALYAELGLTHHRLSIEWARIEPEEGKRDPEAVEHYQRILTAARDAGIEPWVCLFHFTLPRWFGDAGSFLDPAQRTGAWARHVDFVAETFGDLVAGWKPMNEANLFPALAYRGGGFPPGHDDREEFALAIEALHLAKAEAATRLRETGRPVCSIYSLTPVVTHDDEPATAAAAARHDGWFWQPWIGLVRDGVLRVPHREPVERPDLAGCFDLIGFSYYAALGIASGQPTIQPPGAEVSPLGYGIWADGLALVLDRIHAELPGTPVVVAEYGIGTDDDTVRADYLRRGLELTRQAIDRGHDIRGFFHWTGVDNYEWLHGYDVRFGIIDADRVVRPSAQVLAAEARGEAR